MSLAVKISDGLAGAAKEAAKWSERSLAGQIEHWAKLGQAIENNLPNAALVSLKQHGPQWQDQLPTDSALRTQIEQTLHHFAQGSGNLQADAPRAAVQQMVQQRQQIAYESDPDDPQGIVQIQTDGSRQRGRLVGRVFHPR